MIAGVIVIAIILVVGAFVGVGVCLGAIAKLRHDIREIRVLMQRDAIAIRETTALVTETNELLRERRAHGQH